MNKDKIIKDLKKRNDSLKMQYEYRNIRCVHLEKEDERLQQENQRLKHNRDKAIEVIDLITPELWNISNAMTYKLKNIKYILKGDSDE